MPRTATAFIVATGIAALATPQLSHAQSFDCSKAATAIEKQICNDPNLSLMDSELGAVYGALRKTLSDAAQAELRNSEAAWIRQRNACDTQSHCVQAAYLQRLGQLSNDYDVFPGWSGDFKSWAELEFSITNTNGNSYQIAVSGAGQNWTCGGALSASLSEDGTALLVSGNQGSVRIQAAGRGLWVPAALDAVVEASGICGASAPSFGGFFARTSGGDQAAPGFDRAPFIHPQIIREFATWLSDSGDQVVAINLTDAQESNRFSGDFSVKSASSKEPSIVSMTDGEQQFSYQFVGTMTNGIHVIKTVQSSSDGSGVFPSLMLLSFRQDHGIRVDRASSVIAEGAARRLLVKHGQIVLGVDWNSTPVVDGNRLFIGTDKAGNSVTETAANGWLTYNALQGEESLSSQ